MSEIELLVLIRDRLNLLLASKDIAADAPLLCNEVLKHIEKHLEAIQLELNALG